MNMCDQPKTINGDIYFEMNFSPGEEEECLAFEIEDEQELGKLR